MLQQHKSGCAISAEGREGRRPGAGSVAGTLDVFFSRCTIWLMTRHVIESLIDTVAAHGDRVAFRDHATRESVTYREYLESAARIAGGLRESGLERGGRVLLMMSNRPEFHCIDAGVMLAGGVPVSIYNTSSPEEIGHIVRDSQARYAFVEGDEFLERWMKSGECQGITIYVLEETHDNTKKSYRDLLEGEPIDPREASDEIVPEDLATVIYTSGTTGPSKGVMLSHLNISVTVGQLMQAAGMGDEAGRRTVSYLPMAHIAERMMSHYQPMVAAYEVTCCRDISALPECLRESRPQVMFGVPRVWEKIKNRIEEIAATDPERSRALREAVEESSRIKQREREGTPEPGDRETLEFLEAVAFKTVRELSGLDALQYAVSGAAALPVDVLRWFEAVGVPISEIYGMSESSGPMTWSPLSNKPGFVGKAMPGGEIRLESDGEVCYRGPNVFVGYWNNTDKTCETLRDGWLYSGDVGEIDQEGYLRIIDRKKDLIVTSGGKNISPSNIEAELRGIPFVGQAAVIGDGRPYCVCLISLDPEYLAARGGEYVFAPGQVPLDVLREIDKGVEKVNEKFARVEQVKKYAIVPDYWIPGDDVMTPTSKIKRKAVALKYQAEIEEMYRD